jgi:hypothetical protein
MKIKKRDNPFDESDPNHQNLEFYRKSLIDENWYNKYNGKHIIIVNSQVVDEDLDLKLLLVRVRTNYPHESKLYKFVTREEPVAHLGGAFLDIK